MRTIRASEIGVYQYCTRAWWYRIKNVPSENREEMNSGNVFHLKHGRQVLVASLLRLAGWILLLLAVVLLAVALTIRWLN